MFSWQKGDRPDNKLRWAMQHRDKKNRETDLHQWPEQFSGQISSRPHTTSPQEVAKEGNSPYFREI